MGVVQQFESCGGCGFRRYCSKECQRQHWRKGHNTECAKMKEYHGGVASKKALHIAASIQSRILRAVEDPSFVTQWHRLAQDFMKRGNGVKGVIVLLLESIEEGEEALQHGIRPGVGKMVQWVGMENPSELSDVVPEMSRCVSQYHPDYEFVFNVDMRKLCNATSIINVKGNNKSEQTSLFSARTNPFDSAYSLKRVMLPAHVVVGDAIDSEARTKLAKYIKDCLRALGLHKTPHVVSQRLEEYVHTNTEYYGHVAHEDTVFIFYCNPTSGSDIVLTSESQYFTDVTVAIIVNNHNRAVILM